jgi:hypothetical protein
MTHAPFAQHLLSSSIVVNCVVGSWLRDGSFRGTKLTDLSTAVDTRYVAPFPVGFPTRRMR